MRVIMLTSNGDRHLYVAGIINRAFPLTELWVEPKQYQPENAYTDETGRAILDRWFQGRSEAETNFFRSGAESARQELAEHIRQINPGELNSEANVRQMEALQPDAAVVFGSSLLREPLIEAGNRVLNMHLGLSPYYRGAGTNFWPFYNNELEYVGVTIHYIDRGIDTGPILRQTRPDIQEDDTPHTIGCKTIDAGARLMVETLNLLNRGELPGTPQRHDLGRLYKRADFAPEHVLVVEQRVRDGMIRDYARGGAVALELVQ